LRNLRIENLQIDQEIGKIFIYFIMKNNPNGYAKESNDKDV